MENNKNLYPKKSIDNTCDKYEKIQGPQILYERHNKKFCRSHTRKAIIRNLTRKRKNNQTILTKKKKKSSEESEKSSESNEKPIKQVSKKTIVDPYTACLAAPKHEINMLANLFNVENPDDVCGLMQSWRFHSNPSLKTIKLVASTLGISVKKFASKTKDKVILKKEKKEFEEKEKVRLLESIRHNTEKYLNPEFKKWLLMEQPNVSWNETTTKWLVVLMSKIIMPDGFSEHAPMEISEELYKHYIEELWKEDPNIRSLILQENDQISFQKLDPLERNDLRAALVEKFSSCVAKFVFRNRALSLLSNYNKKGFDPIEICNQSILVRPRKIDDKEQRLNIEFSEKLLEKCDPLVKNELSR